jgi:hypothetical protein
VNLSRIRFGRIRGYDISAWLRVRTIEVGEMRRFGVAVVVEPELRVGIRRRGRVTHVGTPMKEGDIDLVSRCYAKRMGLRVCRPAVNDGPKPAVAASPLEVG